MLRFLGTTARWFGPRSGALVLGALLLLLLSAGTRGGWVSFPMTAPVPAAEVVLAGLPGGPLVFGLAVVAALVSLVSPGLGCVLLGVAALLLLSVPVEVAVAQPEWLRQYIVQTADRLDLGAFLADRYVLNLSPEPALVPLDRIDGIDDQLHVAWLSLGRPWYLALGTCLGLLFIAASRWRHAWRGRLFGGAMAVVAALLFIAPAQRLLQAQSLNDAGARAVAAGQGAEALAHFRAAFDTNPALAASRPFWARVATAQAQASGGRDPLSALAQPFALMLQRPQPDAEQPYAEAARVLDTVWPAPADALQAGLQRAASDLRVDVRVRQAVLLDAEGLRTEALAVLQRARPAPDRAARLYLADLTMRQGGHLQAVDILASLDAVVAHPTLRADIACTRGDALTGAGRLQEAREAYLVCKDYDEVTNYRLSRALGGT